MFYNLFLTQYNYTLDGISLYEDVHIAKLDLLINFDLLIKDFRYKKFCKIFENALKDCFFQTFVKTLTRKNSKHLYFFYEINYTDVIRRSEM
jgi:hypothetical protein